MKRWEPALRAVGKHEEAIDALKASHAIYCQLGFEPDAQRISRLIAAPDRLAR